MVRNQVVKSFLILAYYNIIVNLICVSCNSKKTKKQKHGCKADFMGRPLLNIYKFWNFDNRFLVGVGFKFLKLRW